MNTNTQLRLLAVLAHPDDESLGIGGTLARYAAEGVETYLLTATRGERGRFGAAGESPGPDIVGQTRERELRAAAARLGVREVAFLGYLDGDLDQAVPEEAIDRISFYIRRIRPQVVVTFGPEGAYGHPDHIAISQFATAAVMDAANPAVTAEGSRPHCVSKLYYIAWPPAKWELYQKSFKELGTTVDGVRRGAAPFPDWAITTRIDATSYWPVVWQAVRCHETQMAIYQNLERLSDDQHRLLWGRQAFYRVFSLVNGGRQPECDLFEGCRTETRTEPIPYIHNSRL